MDKIKFSSVDEYKKSFPREIQDRINKIRNIINNIAPDAIEIISYNMPAYKLNKKILIYFAVHKEYIGFYPLPSAIKEFQSQLKDFKTSKGGIQFPFSKPLPEELIRKIIKFRAKENLD